MKLKDYQIDAIKRMRNGCILCGGVGSGKSITSLSYYCKENGINPEHPKPAIDSMKNPIQDLYIITTARKRDTLEWEHELTYFLMSTDKSKNNYWNTIVVDSWNNIQKYANVKDAFFIFDEQRVVGYGSWTKNFLKITSQNNWILLSATPGDTWMDYMPVFIANGFYKNKTEFLRTHVVYKNSYTNYPQIDRYVETGRLMRLRNRILVDMDFARETKSHNIDIWCNYDTTEYRRIYKERFSLIKNEPIQNAAEFCSELRRVVNSDTSRLNATLDIVMEREKVIIFYNFDYELELLKNLFSKIDSIEVAEWNGHKHQDIPNSHRWVYLVQYNAGAEGWNCIKTDTMIFYSQNYSYKMREQASGRINRMNTPFKDLYYYELKSHASIDLAIQRAIKNKKKFNESRFSGDI